MPLDPTNAAATTSPATSTRRRETFAAVGMVGILVGVMAGVGHAHLTGSYAPPTGVYVATFGYAVATLWLVARMFSRKPG